MMTTEKSLRNLLALVSFRCMLLDYKVSETNKLVQ